VRLIPLWVTTCSFEKWDVRDAITEAATEADAASKIAQVRSHVLHTLMGAKLIMTQLQNPISLRLNSLVLFHAFFRLS
jgi:hypothetical protein